MNFKNIEAEKAVIGMCLNSQDTLDQAIDTGLSSAHFYLDAHKIIFAEMMKSRASGLPTDLVAIGTKKPELLSAIVEMSTASGVAQNVVYYTNIVKNCHDLNQYVQKLSALHSQLTGITNHDDLKNVKDLIEQTFHNMLYAGEAKVFRSLDTTEVLKATLEGIEEKIKLRLHGINPFIDTGIPKLDVILAGFQPGALYTVGARSGEGKTTSAINFAVRALKNEKHVLYFTTEMPEPQIMEKFLALVARIDYNKINTGNLSDAENDRLADASRWIHAGQKLIINRPCAGLMEKIELEARRLKRIKKLDFLIIDYIQQVGFEAKDYENPINKITEVTKRVKNLALDLKIPIIACAQLNREVAKDNKMPACHHLRDSGSIEQDSDCVMLLHREKQANNLPTGVDYMIVDKNRHGTKGIVKLEMNLEFCEIKQSKYES